MSRIPVEMLSKMSTFDVEIQGVRVTGHVVDRVDVLEKHLPDLLRHISHTSSSSNLGSSSPTIVGVDLKEPYDGRQREHILVIYARGRCMIIFLDAVGHLPESFLKFLKDPKTCFVGFQSLPYVNVKNDGSKCCNFGGVEVGVKAGDLVARLMRKPDMAHKSLADIAGEVEVKYVGPARGVKVMYNSQSKGTDQSGCTVQLDCTNPTVLTKEQVKLLINDAFVHYQIGSKVLSSLGL